MSTTTIVVMVLYLAVVWGLLLVAAIHLARTDDEAIGTLGAADLDDLPQYTRT
ncbi:MULTISPECIES: methionine/alanine import family NSS transporter small subunit [Corynebacterium]|uniref:Methionine and alanine importer, small subunit n=2 Tax=Corynebacterium TaxID=1716 RepID=A0A3G6IXS0_9CORY|nr:MULTISPECIES: methionine/alanine import family NSS transporter small subunit [Corynebacterium]AZA08362.1 hypothetical protein CPPEL_01075 [Corynebacterium pseudopelargi]AZA10569.1 hypothetical protein CGERO_01175 [Corynebacterium gerontici]